MIYDELLSKKDFFLILVFFTTKNGIEFEIKFKESPNYSSLLILAGLSFGHLVTLQYRAKVCLSLQVGTLTVKMSSIKVSIHLSERKTRFHVKV